MGVVTGPFSATRVRLDGVDQLLGNVLAILLVGVGAGGEALPFELHAGSFQDANGGADDLGTDAVARDQGNFMCHELPVYALLPRAGGAK